MVVQVAWRDVTLFFDDVASMNMIKNRITKPKRASLAKPQSANQAVHHANR
jgi:hypothetical protein